MSGSSTRGSTLAERQRRRSIIVLSTLGAVLVIAFVVALAFVQGWLPPKGDATPTARATTTQTCTASAAPAPKSITVNVYNATQRAGLAATTAQALGGQGFVVGTVTNDPLQKAVPGVAEIRHGAAGLAKAQALAARFPGATLLKDARTDETVDVAVGDKFTAVVTPTATPAPTTC